MSSDLSEEPASKPGRRAAEGMAGLAKGLAILEAFGPAHPRLTIAEAARLSGTTRAAARRCLLTLVELGYLDHDGRMFRPQPRLMRLGSGYLSAAALPRLAQPVLDAARDRLGESVSLSVLENGWSAFVARAQSERIVNTGVSVGARLPAYCSATGRVLLGSLEEGARAAYFAALKAERRTPRTPTDPVLLADIVRRALADGFAATDEELELGLRSLAVPVRCARGHIQAALSVSASSARVEMRTMLDVFLPVLAQGAAQIGRGL